MSQIDFFSIVRDAWQSYDKSREIKLVTDISAMVSTNHVYRIRFKDDSYIIAKLSYFGRFEHFVEDHTIINSLSNNLPAPFENFLARSLMKGNKLYVHHHKSELFEAWVVFYRPIAVKKKLPKRLELEHIDKLAVQFAKFHLACTKVKNTLPTYSKSLKEDVQELLDDINSDVGYYEFGVVKDMLVTHCNEFLAAYDAANGFDVDSIPVFVDWNIGNFSVTKSMKLYSRWDYDWFRMSTRVMDFYFLSRVMSDVGDRTVFTYNIEVMYEDRFIRFLKEYHKVFPLKAYEIDFLPESYRFFLLNYVVKFGRYFFHEIYANKLRAEAYETHLPSVYTFDTDYIKKELGL